MQFIDYPDTLAKKISKKESERLAAIWENLKELSKNMKPLNLNTTTKVSSQK